MIIWWGCIPYDDMIMLVLLISNYKGKPCWWWEISDYCPTPNSPLLYDHKGGVGSSINSQYVNIMLDDSWLVLKG